MGKYRFYEDTGRTVDSDSRLIARTTNANFYISEDNAAPPEQRYRIKSRGSADLSFSGSSPEALVNELRKWAQGCGKILLSYNLTRGL